MKLFLFYCDASLGKPTRCDQHWVNIQGQNETYSYTKSKRVFLLWGAGMFSDRCGGWVDARYLLLDMSSWLACMMAISL